MHDDKKNIVKQKKIISYDDIDEFNKKIEYTL